MNGLKFGDRHNMIDDDIRTGVTEDAPTTDSLHNVHNPDITTNSIQHDVLVANEEHHVGNANGTREVDVIEIEDGEEIEDNESNVSNNDQEDKSNIVAPDNMEDEATTEMEITDSDPICVTRLGSVIKPYDHLAKFPETAQGKIRSEKRT